VTAPIQFSDLLTTQTSAQVRTTLVGALKTLGIPADQWNAGGALSVMLTVIATTYAMLTVLMAQAIGSGFLPTASGQWLTLLAYYVYGVTRPGGTFANGQVTLTNTAGGSFVYGAQQVVFLDTVNGQTYLNIDPLSLVGVGATATIAIQCQASGTIGSAAPGEINALVTQMPGVTVANASAVVGLDPMTDANLRTLCLNRLAASSVRGPRNAYAYAIQVAVNSLTGAPVNVNRFSISRSSHTGIVSIVVASPSGVPLSTDVAGVVTSIESGVPGLVPPFSGARPDCVTVNTTAAIGVPYSKVLTLWTIATAGVSAAQSAAAAAAALTTYLESYPVGGVTTDEGSGLFASGIAAAISAGAPAPLITVEGASASLGSDVALALVAGQVATNSVSTINVRQVTLS
jgi:Baseplate J-like protein